MSNNLSVNNKLQDIMHSAEVLMKLRAIPLQKKKRKKEHIHKMMIFVASRTFT